MKLFRILSQGVQAIPERSYRDREVGGEGELTLETFLVDHPEVIPGEEIDSEAPPVFVVVQQQAGVTSGSIDILLLDQFGVPTVVETKLIDNREIRRSVLAQELEYLAHLQMEWDAKRILAAAEAFWGSREHSFADEAIQCFGQEPEEDYWGCVQANLESGTMRLIVAADEIPAELRTVIEFLNETARFDVFGLEVRFFAVDNDSAPILAPQVLGSSERAKGRKRSLKRAVGNWDEQRFFEVLTQTHPEREEIAQLLLHLGERLTSQKVRWGVGIQTGSFTVHTKIERIPYSLYSVYTDGTFTINIGWSNQKLAKLDPLLVEKYRQLACDTFGIDLDAHLWIHGYPKAPLSALESHIAAIQSYFEQFVDEVTTLTKNSPAG